MTATTYIGLHGPKRIGKSTMLKHLLEHYEVGHGDPGTPMKMLYMMSEDSDYWGRRYLAHGWQGMLEEARELQDKLLEDYENAKRLNAGSADAFREAIIGFAEMFRMFDPDIWVKASKALLSDDCEIVVGGIINDGELRGLERHYDKIFVVELVCENPAMGKESETDSRAPLSPHTNPILRFTYKLEHSKIVADNLIRAYNVVMDKVSGTKIEVKS